MDIQDLDKILICNESLPAAVWAPPILLLVASHVVPSANVPGCRKKCSHDDDLGRRVATTHPRQRHRVPQPQIHEDCPQKGIASCRQERAMCQFDFCRLIASLPGKQAVLLAFVCSKVTTSLAAASCFRVWHGRATNLSFVEKAFHRGHG